MVSFKYLSNFWRTLEIPLINYEVNVILTWSANCVIIYTNVANQNPTFEITQTKLYIPVVALSSQDNAKLLLKLKSSFQRKIIGKKTNLNHLVELSFQEVNRLFVLAFKNDAQKTSNKRCYLPNLEIKDYKVMIDEKNLFDQSVKNYKNLKTLEKLLLVKDMIMQLIVC